MKPNHKMCGWEADVHSKWCRKHFCSYRNHSETLAKDKRRSRKIQRRYWARFLENELKNRDEVTT